MLRERPGAEGRIGAGRGRARSTLVILAVGLLAAVPGACDAASESAVSTRAAPTERATAREPEVPLEPTPLPTPDLWLSFSERLVLLQDVAFIAASRDTCRATRPDELASLHTPDRPQDKGPGYGTVQMVVSEVIGPDGRVTDPPSPVDDSDWAGFWQTYRGEDAAVSGADDIELLACVALRTGASSQYSGGGGVFTLHKTSEIAWMVERASGRRVGVAWVIGDAYAVDVAFPLTLLNATTLTAGDLGLLPLGGQFGGSVGERLAGSIVAFLGGVRPEVGGFEQLRAWQGDQVLLPTGFALFDPQGSPSQPMYGQTFIVRLVVLDPGSVAFGEVFCAPGGTTNGESLRVGVDIPLDLGRFEAVSSDVELAGDFTYPDEAGGMIRGLSAAADRCGVPTSASWVAGRVLDATADGAGYALQAEP